MNQLITRFLQCFGLCGNTQASGKIKLPVLHQSGPLVTDRELIKQTKDRVLTLIKPNGPIDRVGMSRTGDIYQLEVYFCATPTLEEETELHECIGNVHTEFHALEELAMDAA